MRMRTKHIDDDHFQRVERRRVPFSTAVSTTITSFLFLPGKMNYVILLLAVICSIAIGAPESLDHTDDGEFMQWVSRYYDGDDLERIYPTWRRNADFVKHHNSLSLSYTVAMNKFVHLVSQPIDSHQQLWPYWAAAFDIYLY